MGGGTEAFPDLGKHCQNPECNQLDFLPFKCDGCQKVFCLEHRSYKAHECPKSYHKSRKVIVCETCAVSIGTTGNDLVDEKEILERHVKSGLCDPLKKKRPVCPVKKCKEVLTFSNTTTCKTCHAKVCLKHRFPEDHACRRLPEKAQTAANAVPVGSSRWNDKFLAALSLREGKECAKEKKGSGSTPTTPSLEAH